MPNHKGSEGTVKVGANDIAELKSWSVDEAADTPEDTTMGDTARTFKSSLTGWTGSAECLWDETDTTGQGAMTIGAEVTLNLYPEGAASTATYKTGSAIITGITLGAAFDGMVETSFTFQGNGALTEATVT